MTSVSAASGGGTSSTACELVDVDPALLRRWLDAGEAVLVDVREDFEHAEERIAGAHHRALTCFDAAACRGLCDGKRLVFHCKGGKRSADAARRFARPGERVFHLAGGIEAWKAAGMPTVRPTKAPRLGVMRQVQLIAGGLVAAGTALGAFVSPWFLAVPAFVGCGLAFAGATGWCGMAVLLARMPWNKGLSSGASCAA